MRCRMRSASSAAGAARRAGRHCLGESHGTRRATADAIELPRVSGTRTAGVRNPDGGCPEPGRRVSGTWTGMPDDRVSAVVAGVRSSAGHPSERPTVADTSTAADTSLAPCAGHQPSGRWSCSWSGGRPATGSAQPVEHRLSCLRRGGVMPDPMTDEERALLEHRWAVRVDLPGQASHAAQVARRLVEVAADAHLDAPAVVVRAVAALEGYAVAVHERVQAERAELQRRGVDTATFQQDLERGTLSPPPDQADQ